MKTETATPIRETRTDHGRAYQPAGGLRAWVDWTPPAPLAGHRTLTGGIGKVDEIEGPIVEFRERAGNKVVCVRITPERETLRELVGIADRLDGEIQAEEEAHVARMRALRLAQSAADIAAFEATLPPEYVAIEEVQHNPAAGDGWGLTRYRHRGVVLTEREVDAMGARRHDLLGDPYRLLVYAPADRLAEIVGRKRAAAEAKGRAAAEAKAATAAEREARIAQAREAGRPVEIDRWTEECDGEESECNLDIVVRYAMPDGSLSTRRTHTH
jgi:hypothetical protein